MPPVYRYQPWRRADARHRRHDRLHRYRKMAERNGMQLDNLSNRLFDAGIENQNLRNRLAAVVESRRRSFVFGACVGLAVSWLVRLVA